MPNAMSPYLDFTRGGLEGLSSGVRKRSPVGPSTRRPLVADNNSDVASDVREELPSTAIGSKNRRINCGLTNDRFAMSIAKPKVGIPKAVTIPK